MLPTGTRTKARIALSGTAVLALAVFATFLARTPSADRDWAEDQTVLPTIAIEDGIAHLAGVRDFAHDEDGIAEIRYRDVAVDLAEVRSVWLGLAPFANRFRGLAHSFLSFDLGSGRFLTVSVEARRQVGEEYSLIGGLLRGFEVAYVIGTEEDLIGLRILRGDEIYLYPTIATPEQSRALLEDMLHRARRTQLEPEFYNTLVNNCVTNLRDHVNRVTEADLPWGWGILLPGFSDQLALDQGLLDTDLELADARLRFRVDRRGRIALQDGARDFSRRIREAGAQD